MVLLYTLVDSCLTPCHSQDIVTLEQSPALAKLNSVNVSEPHTQNANVSEPCSDYSSVIVSLAVITQV